MTESLTQESELIKTGETVNEDLICFRTESHESAAGADLQVCDLVGIRDLCHWLSFVTIPEEDGAAATGGNKLELVIFSLTHGGMESVLSLARLNAFLLLEIIGGQGAISAARVDPLRLVTVREESHDVFFLVVELDEKLASAAIPDTDGTILTTSQDVILVSVDCSHSSSVGL